MSYILELKSVVKSFGGLCAVDNASFKIEENSITGLIGPNGAGKTTIFDLITGLLTADSGQITFKHEDIIKSRAWERSKSGIARTFQSIRLFPELTVIDNILAALPHSPDSFLDIFKPLKKKKKEMKTQAVDMLKIVSLENHALSHASSLSYGQQKLLEIIRAYASGGDLFLLDEPAAGINRTMLHHVINLIKYLKSIGKTIVIVEHDMNFVMALCERIIVLDRGKEIAKGTPAEIRKNPLVLDAYLGKHHMTNLC